MTEKKSSFEFSEQIRQLKDAAYRDSLTGLMNRGAAEKQIEDALAGMKEGDNCMLLIVDLDNFKMVNDTLGHQTGDKVIRTVADILSSLFRPGDVVARLGGDEYIIFLCGNVTRKLAESKGEAICDNLRLTVGDRNWVSISSSVGIYFSTGRAASFQEMYRMADTALYKAKNSGKNRHFISENENGEEENPEKDRFGTAMIVREDKQGIRPGGKNISLTRGSRDRNRTGEQNWWEVDLKTKQFEFHSRDLTFLTVQDEDCVFPYGLVNSGWVAPESVGRFIKFATGIFTGKVSGYGNFLIRTGDGMDYAWATLSYRTQGDIHGVPCLVSGKAVPLSEDIRIEKIPFARKNTIPVPVIDGLIVKLDANITNDFITKIWTEGNFQEQEYKSKPLSYFVVNEGRKICDRSDKVEFTNFFFRENLLNLYKNGIYWFFTEYRRIDGAGYMEWVTLAVNLYRKTLDEDIQIRLSINNCDDRHLWESYSSQEDIRNRETNLHSPLAVRKMLCGLQAEAVSEFCAAVLIRIEGFDEMFSGDEKKKDGARKYVVNMLSYTLGTHCIATKADEEHYIFFFPDIYSSSYLNRILEMAFHYSRLLLSEIMPANPIRFFAAVSCAMLRHADYDELLSECTALSEEYQAVTEDKIVFRREKSAEREDSSAFGVDFEKKVTVIDSKAQVLDEAEQRVFSDCLSDMLLASSAEKGIRKLFGRLGNYYGADRMYMLSLKNTNRDIEVFCEWRLPHLETISIILSRTSMDKLQLLTRCSIEKKPLHYFAKVVGKEESEGPEENEWRYCIFPVRFSNQAYTVTDFLCLENPRKEGINYALIEKLLPYIKNQKLKISLHAENTAIAGKNRLEGLPNLLEYIHAIPKIISREYTNMGAYVAKVSRLSILNSHHGFEYGRSMLQYIADTFAEVLGNQYLFRTWDNEFIAILPEVSQETAEKKFKRLKVTFEKKYGEHIFVNYRWTETGFTSRELMDMPKSGIRGNIIDVEKYLKTQASGSADLQVEEYGYTVHMQPVFDIRSSEVAGAEILVRGIDKSRNIVLPRRFLKQMEHDETIKNIDLFVLEQAFLILEGWKEKGIREIPLSVNFSKATILNNTILASYLAVRSRYPQLGDSKIGIEIPQNIGSEHYGKLASTMEQLREFGAEFTVDDIGVDKENAKILNQIRFDAVKIDHSLMLDVEFSESARQMIRAIIGSCAETGAVCVAEGIETKEQLSMIQGLGCRYAQGFYYGRPVTVEEFNRKYMS